MTDRPSPGVVSLTPELVGSCSSQSSLIRNLRTRDRRAGTARRPPIWKADCRDIEHDHTRGGHDSVIDHRGPWPDHPLGLHRCVHL